MNQQQETTVAIGTFNFDIYWCKKLKVSLVLE